MDNYTQVIADLAITGAVVVLILLFQYLKLLLTEQIDRIKDERLRAYVRTIVFQLEQQKDLFDQGGAFLKERALIEVNDYVKNYAINVTQEHLDRLIEEAVLIVNTLKKGG